MNKIKSILLLVLVDFCLISFSTSLRTIVYLHTKSTVKNLTATENLNNVDGFCPNCESYLLVHGWQASKSDWMINMKNELFAKNSSTNVFIVDWGFGSDLFILSSNDLFGYEQSINFISEVSQDLFAYFSYFIENQFINKTSSNLLNVHCVGHSLGAHVCGYFGKLMQKSNSKLLRITGMDPAGPCFMQYPNEKKLTKEDAFYLDIIHTSEFLGYKDPIGHSNYYPNGGSKQPGCKQFINYEEEKWAISILICSTKIDLEIEDVNVKALLQEFNLENIIEQKNYLVLRKNTLEVYARSSELVRSIKLSEKNPIAMRFVQNLFDILTICSHSRAYEYFIESINSNKCRFYATECSSWNNFRNGKCSDCDRNQMGLNSARMTISENITSYYLSVNSKSPYCKADVLPTTTRKNSPEKIYCKSDASSKYSYISQIFLTQVIFLILVINIQ